jgi:hypothetical protein
MVDLIVGSVSGQDPVGSTNTRLQLQPATDATSMVEVPALPRVGDSMQRSLDTASGQFLDSIPPSKATSPTSPLAPLYVQTGHAQGTANMDVRSGSVFGQAPARGTKTTLELQPTEVATSMVVSPTSLSGSIQPQSSDTNPVDQFLHGKSPSRDPSSPASVPPSIKQPLVQSSNTHPVDQFLHGESPSGDSSSMLLPPASVLPSVLPSVRQPLVQSNAVTSSEGLTLEQVRLIGSLYEQNLSPQTISGVINELTRREETNDASNGPPTYESFLQDE